MPGTDASNNIRRPTLEKVDAILAKVAELVQELSRHPDSRPPLPANLPSSPGSSQPQILNVDPKFNPIVFYMTDFLDRTSTTYLKQLRSTLETNPSMSQNIQVKEMWADCLGRCIFAKQLLDKPEKLKAMMQLGAQGTGMQPELLKQELQESENQKAIDFGDKIRALAAELEALCAS